MSFGFIVGRVSDRANIATVLAHTAQDSGLDSHLTGPILSIPPLMPYCEVEEKYKIAY